MLQVDKIEKIIKEYLEEEPCLDYSCANCKEIKQLRDDRFMGTVVNQIIKHITPFSLYEDIYQTFYLGLKVGRELEKLNYS